MTSYEYEFFKWGTCKSKDESKPDILELKLMQELFDAEYSPCIRAVHEGKEKIFSISYTVLLMKIKNALKDGSLSVGKNFKIITHLGISKFDNTRTPRRFRLDT